jgi:aminomethyltransferase
LKKYIALATVERSFAMPGAHVDIEVTIEHARKTTGATVVKTPFFDPPRKRALVAPSNGK